VKDASFEPRALQIGKLSQIRKSLQIGEQSCDVRGFIANTSIAQRISQKIIHRH